VGILLLDCVSLLLALDTGQASKQLTSACSQDFTLVFALPIPFLLRDAYERYFYLADVVSIIFAFSSHALSIEQWHTTLLTAQYAPYFFSDIGYQS